MNWAPNNDAPREAPDFPDDFPELCPDCGAPINNYYWVEDSYPEEARGRYYVATQLILIADCLTPNCGYTYESKGC